MESRPRKRHYIFCICLIFLLGACTSFHMHTPDGMQSKMVISECEEARDCTDTADLERRVQELELGFSPSEMDLAAGVAASFYPYSGGLTGGTAGALDKTTSTNDKDTGMVVLNADHATYPLFFGIYTLDVDSGLTEDAPWVIDSGDAGNEDWLLNKVYGRGFASGQGAAGPGYIDLYEDSDNGTNYVRIIAASSLAATYTLTLPSANDTFVGKATTDTLTNKTFDADGTGNSLSNVDMANDVTGTLAVGNGGSGGTSFTDGGILLGSTAAAFTAMAVLGDGAIVVGDGTTDPVALTAFTSSTGDVTHEAGGLEADVSAYSGLLAISGGATSEVDAKSELETQIADVADFAEADGDTYTGAHDFGGATSIEIVNATDPDVDAAGEISFDTDGANESGDAYHRGYDGTNQFAFGRKLECIHVTVIAPNDLADAERDRFPVWANNTGMVFTITEIKGYSDTDDTTLNVEVVTATNWTTRNTIDALEIATNGTGVFTVTETTISDATIAHDETITLDFDDTDDPGVVQITICGWYNANID